MVGFFAHSLAIHGIHFLSFYTASLGRLEPIRSHDQDHINKVNDLNQGFIRRQMQKKLYTRLFLTFFRNYLQLSVGKTISSSENSLRFYIFSHMFSNNKRANQTRKYQSTSIEFSYHYWGEKNSSTLLLPRAAVTA